MHRHLFALGCVLTFTAALVPGAHAVVIEFDTTLESLQLSGGPYPMPLASDPGNNLGDSIDGYGFVDTAVSITLSSQRPADGTPPGPGPASAGEACAINNAAGFANGIGCPLDRLTPGHDPIDPRELDGQTFFVDSFFDVFFDITVTDVDPRPGRDFAGQVDGASFLLPDNGPAAMLSTYQAVFDQDAPNFGLIPPPQVAPYIGHFLIEIPLGGDINGNGEDDKIKFTIASHAVGDENRTFIQLPDGTIIDEFDSAAFLAGVIVDVSTDPPFTLGAGSPSAPAFSGPGALTGPTTATSTLLNPVANQPPDCTGATASPAELWPPNHKFADVSVVGATDPDGDPITVTITNIAQDEPLDGPGDGNTCPDASGVGTDVASVRAERSGTKTTSGDGRVYHISFAAEDGRGGACSGTVQVCVPHDSQPGGACVDQGPVFDSTLCE